LATKDCMNFRCDRLDTVIAGEALQALQPAQLELALAALRELESRDHAIHHQWQMRLERAEYEAALAERRYQEVDPSNRLVAGTLEQRWNEALLQVDSVKQQAADGLRREARVATAEQHAQVLALAKDLPRVWHATTTQAKDRKRMLRLLIKDITVEKAPHQKTLVAHIRWQGGACTDHLVELPPKRADAVRYPAAIVDRVRALASRFVDAEIADQFNRDGQISATGKPYTTKMIQWIRGCHRIPPPTLKTAEERTVQQVATHFGVSDHVVYYWIDRRLLHARRLNGGMPYWITLDVSTEQKLRAWVRNSSRIQQDHASHNPPDGGAV
jgi:hypothetical protein